MVWGMALRLVTLYALARQLHLPAAWLKAEARAGRIPALQIRRGYYFTPPAVEAALAVRAAFEIAKPRSPKTKPTRERGPVTSTKRKESAP